ncbi:hypothetical protein [Cloacibacterium sp.]|uniref:hypothetical protein n=1 Tax=Cloacibacterium sp. TaxID=1913682 RepID=UPI0039E5DB15
MKLKKHNYAAIAVIVLYCFVSYKSFSYKRFKVLLVVITSLFSSYIYSQQVTISGLENIHISEGASIVAEHTDNKITVITSSSTKSYSQEEKFLITKNDVNQNKKKVYKKENIAKKSKSNSLKKFENIKNFAIFTNTDSESSSSFEIANVLQKQCTNRSNNGNESLLKPENNWKIALINYQTKDNILYLFYHSKKANDSLFARPPPVFI